MTASLPFDIIIDGRFAPQDISTRWTDEPRRSTPEVDRLIEREWALRLAEAERRGALLYDGRLARYVSHEVVDSRLVLTLGPTCYRDFVGTNLYHPDLADRLGWECLSNPVGTTATLITADGYLVYGRRSGRVAFHAGHLHTLGGSLEAVDRRADGTVDVLGSLLRELAEELDMDETHIRRVVCAGMIRDHEIRQPELLFEADVTLTRQQLADRVASGGEEDEHTRVESCEVRPEAIVPFIRAAAPVAPVAVGALLLFGRGRWGDTWLSSAAEALRRNT